MRHHMAFSTLGITLFLTAAGCSEPYGDTDHGTPWATSVHRKTSQVGDLAHLLGVKQYSGECEFSGRVEQVALTFDLYKDGKRVKLPDTLRADLQIEHGGDVARFAFQAADLDRLPLGGAKPNHCRVLLELSLSDGAVSTTRPVTVDIPKELFDLTELTGYTPLARGFANRRPLFILYNQEFDHYSPDKAIEDVLRQNPKGMLLVATLWYQKDYERPQRPGGGARRAGDEVASAP